MVSTRRLAGAAAQVRVAVTLLFANCALSIGITMLVKIVVYPGARHAFDVAELPAKTRYGFGTIGYNSQAAAAARDEVQRFLRPAR